MVQGRYNTIELRYKNVTVVISRRFVPGNHSWYVSTILDAKIHSINNEGLPYDVYQIFFWVNIKPEESTTHSRVKDVSL
jgi:hypothetical protein